MVDFFGKDPSVSVYEILFFLKWFESNKIRSNVAYMSHSVVKMLNKLAIVIGAGNFQIFYCTV